MKKPVRQNDGMYHVNGKKYPELFGSRSQVWNGTAYKTSGGLTKEDLLKLSKEIVDLYMKHNAEADACDLLMEIENVEILIDYVEKDTYQRVCLYLLG